MNKTLAMMMVMALTLAPAFSWEVDEHMKDIIDDGGFLVDKYSKGTTDWEIRTWNVASIDLAQSYVDRFMDLHDNYFQDQILMNRVNSIIAQNKYMKPRSPSDPVYVMESVLKPGSLIMLVMFCEVERTYKMIVMFWYVSRADGTYIYWAYD